MKILAIGDPHGDLDKVKRIPKKGIDLILLTGDLGKANFAREFYFNNVEREKKGLERIEYGPKEAKKSYMEIYTSSMRILKYCSKFAPTWLIFGNVESSDAEVRKMNNKYGLDLPLFVNETNNLDNVSIINNRIRNFRGVRMGGLEYFVDTHWVRDFKPSDYKERMKSAKKQTDKARKVLKWFSKYDLDILLHHQPPHSFLDEVGGKAPKHWRGKNAGSKVILDYIKKRQPKYAFCGHIHEGEGKSKIGKTEVYNLGVGGYKIIEF